MTDKPTNPTDGWMRSELERLGVPNRGQPLTTKQLADLLRARGYTIHLGRDRKTGPDR